ncbi:MAG TPA: HPP family protein [Candidatus Binataceae bacterium]|nr:HPP family protein [Candidatus Binataceae bacterium]
MAIEERVSAESRDLSRRTWYRIAAELIGLSYIALIAGIASVTGLFYVMFPELGALSHDVFTRPRGTWAAAPVLLVITPLLTALIGIFFTRLLPYGYISVLLTVGGAVTVMVALDSPIAPAISAGLLPLVVGIKSWWYPPAILLGTILLALISIPWKRIGGPHLAMAVRPATDLVDDALEEPPAGRNWIVALMTFVAAAVTVVKLTGLRFVLFPPLVVIGFEMLGHPTICPWAKRPWWLPIACFLTAAGGFLSSRWLGVGPLAAGLSMGWGILVLRVFDLHIPPAIAVALLPLVMDSPTIAYPFAVGIGTLLMTLWFLLYQRVQYRIPAG